jgi:hypothetical protein
MAKIIQFDPSRKVPPKHYTPEAMRGRLLQFKSPATSVESDTATTLAGKPRRYRIAGQVGTRGTRRT